MKYLPGIYFDEAWQRLGLTERQGIFTGQMELARELTARGQYLGGSILIDVENLDQALAIAARGPVASVGSIEVRPVREGAPTA